MIRQDAETGLRFIVAVHSTVLGPALGGMRLKRYPGGLREALEDVMGLARTMTLKASAAGLDLGGGKAVMIDDGRADQRAERLAQAAQRDRRARRRLHHRRGHRHHHARTWTTWRASRATASGRSVANGGGGDPSPVTAESVFEAIRRGLTAHDGSPDLEGRRVGVIGLGKVGGELAARLAEAGARARRLRPRARALRALLLRARHAEIAPSAEALITSELDVLAPCAGGGLIDDGPGRARYGPAWWRGRPTTRSPAATWRAP